MIRTLILVVFITVSTNACVVDDSPAEELKTKLILQLVKKCYVKAKQKNDSRVEIKSDFRRCDCLSDYVMDNLDADQLYMNHQIGKKVRNKYIGDVMQEAKPYCLD